MTLQFDAATRNAELDAIEAHIGTEPVLRLYSGDPPANTAAAATGTLLGTGTLPSDWMGAAAAGSKALAGTWTITIGTAGDAGHFRLLESTETTVKMQGTVTATGGGGDMTIDDISVEVSQEVTVSTFTLASGND